MFKLSTFKKHSYLCDIIVAQNFDNDVNVKFFKGHMHQYNWGNPVLFTHENICNIALCNWRSFEFLTFFGDSLFLESKSNQTDKY